MGCRPSKQATSKVRAAEEESLDPRCLGSPCHKHRSQGAIRSEGQRVQHSYSEGCHRARAPPNTDADFPAFSTTSAVYRYSASRTSKITLRLSCDGSTLEIEHCDYDLERSRKEREADDITPRLWGSAPDLGKFGQRPGQQTGLCSPPGLMVCGQTPVWPLRDEIPSAGHGDRPEEMKARGGCCQQTVSAVVYDSKGRPVSARFHQLGDDTKHSRATSNSLESETIHPDDKQSVHENLSENCTRSFKTGHGSENKMKWRDYLPSTDTISSNHVENKHIAKLRDTKSGNQETNETRAKSASTESAYQKSLNSQRHNHFNSSFSEVNPASQSPVHEDDLHLPRVKSKTDEENSNKHVKSCHVSYKSSGMQPRDNVNTLSNIESNARRDSQLNTSSLNRTEDSLQDPVSRLDQDKFVLPLRIPDKSYPGKYWCPGVQQDPDRTSAYYWDYTDPNWSHSTISGSCSCFTSDFESADDSDTIMALVALGCPLSSEKGSVCVRCKSFTDTASITTPVCTENVSLACTSSSDSDDFFTPLQEFAPGQVNGVPYPAVPVVRDSLSPISFKSSSKDQNIQETVNEGHVETIRGAVTEPGTEVLFSKSEELRTIEILDSLTQCSNGTDFTSEKLELSSMDVVDGPVVKQCNAKSTDDAPLRKNTALGHRQKGTGEARTPMSEGKWNQNILEMINHVENEIIERLKNLGENVKSDTVPTTDCDQRMNNNGKGVNVNVEWGHQGKGSDVVDEEETVVLRKTHYGEPLPGAKQWHLERSDAPCCTSGDLTHVRPTAIYQSDDVLTTCTHSCHIEREQEERVFNNLATSIDLDRQYNIEPMMHACCTNHALLKSGQGSSEEKEKGIRASGANKFINSNIYNLNSKDVNNCGSFDVKANADKTTEGNCSLSSSEALEEDMMLSGHVTLFHPVVQKLSPDTISPSGTSIFFPVCEDLKERNLSRLKMIEEDLLPSCQTSQHEDLDPSPTLEPLHKEEDVDAACVARDVAPVLTRENVISQSSTGNDVQAAKSLPYSGSCFIQEEIPEDMADRDESGMKSQVIVLRDGILLKNIHSTARQTEMKAKEGKTRETRPAGHDQCENVALGEERKNRLDTLATGLKQGLGNDCDDSTCSPRVSLSSSLPGPLGHQCLSQPSIYACVVESGRSIQGSFTSGLGSLGEGPKSDEGGMEIVGLVGTKESESKRDRLNWTPSQCGLFGVSGTDGSKESRTNLSASVVFGDIADTKNTNTDTACFVDNVGSNDKWKFIYSDTALFNPDAPELKSTSDCDSSSILRALSEIVNSTPSTGAQTSGKSWKHGGSYGEKYVVNQLRRNTAEKEKSGKIGVNVSETAMAREVVKSDEHKIERERVRKSMVEERGKVKVVKETEEQNGRGRKKYEGVLLCHDENVGSGETNRLFSCSGLNKEANVIGVIGNEGPNTFLREDDGHIREFVEWNGDAMGICGRDDKNANQTLTSQEDERHETKKNVENVNSRVAHLGSLEDVGSQKDSLQLLERGVKGETDWVDTRRVCGGKIFNEPMIDKSQTFREVNISPDEGTVCTLALSRKDGSEGKRGIKNGLDEWKDDEEEELRNSVQSHTRQSWNQDESLSEGELRGEGSKIADSNCSPCFKATPNSNKPSPTTEQQVMGEQIDIDYAKHLSLTEQYHPLGLLTHETKSSDKYCETNEWSQSKMIRQTTAPTRFENKQRTAHCLLILPDAKEKSFRGDVATSESKSFVSELDTTVQMESIQLELIADVPEPGQSTDAFGKYLDSLQGSGADFGHSLDPWRPEETQNVLNKQLIDQKETLETKRVSGAEEEEGEDGKEKGCCQLQNTTGGPSNLSQTSVQLLVKYFETFPVGAGELKQ